jgi:hypothetical protein
MKIERFQHLAEAFGGDLSRWPQAEQSAAGALLRTDPAAQRIVADAQALDALLAPRRPAGGRPLRRAHGGGDFRPAGRRPAAKTRRCPRAIILALVGGLHRRYGAGGGWSAARRPPPLRSPAAVAATPVIADSLMGVADAGYYSTRYMAAWAQ